MGEKPEQILFTMVKEQLETNQNISALTLQLLESMGVAVQNQTREMERKVQGLGAVFQAIQEITALEGTESYIPEELEPHTVIDPIAGYVYPVAFYVKDAIRNEKDVLTDAILYAMNDGHGVYYWIMDAEWNYVKNGFLKDMGISSDLELEIIKEKELDDFCDPIMLESSFVRTMILEHCDPQRFTGETAYKLLCESADMTDVPAEKKEENAPSVKTAGADQNVEEETKEAAQDPAADASSEKAEKTDVSKEAEKTGRKKESGKAH